MKFFAAPKERNVANAIVTYNISLIHHREHVRTRRLWKSARANLAVQM